MVFFLIFAALSNSAIKKHFICTLRKILNSNFISVKKFPGLFQEILIFFFFRPGNLFDHFPGFQGFPGCVGNQSEGGLFNIKREEGNCVFMGSFSLSIFQGTKSEKLTKPSEVWPGQYLDLIPTKQI